MQIGIPMTIAIDKKAPITPEFAASIFFSIFALLFFLFSKYTLLSLKTSMVIPIFPYLIITLFTGTFIGKVFGTTLAKPRHWFLVFLIGVFLAFVGILLASLSLLIYSYMFDATLMQRIYHWQDYFIVYGLIALSMMLLIGVWLLPLMGLASVYFNKHFFPGLLAVDALRRSKA
jgi:hypothetical protein